MYHLSASAGAVQPGPHLTFFLLLHGVWKPFFEIPGYAPGNTLYMYYSHIKYVADYSMEQLSIQYGASVGI